MLNKLLKKEILIPVIAVLIALIVGVAILVIPDSEKTGDKESDTKTEQSKDDDDSKVDKEETGADDEGNGGLNVLEPDEVDSKDYSDTTGLWGDNQESDSQTDNTDKTDKTEDPDDNKDEGKEPEKDQEIYKDKITWGDFY